MSRSSPRQRAGTRWSPPPLALYRTWRFWTSRCRVGTGASGFLLKDAPASELATAIRRVMDGQRVVDPGLAAAALSEGENPLTEREREVLSASANGATIDDIATKLYLSEGTVRNYLSTAIKKLGVRNRVEAAHLAEQKGWL